MLVKFIISVWFAFSLSPISSSVMRTGGCWSSKVMEDKNPVLILKSTENEDSSGRISQMIRGNSNGTARYLENRNFTLDVICEASYPIQWIEVYDKNADGMGLNSWDVKKDLWNEIVQNYTVVDEENILYRTEIHLYSEESLKSVSNFSCQSLDNHCLQSNVFLILRRSEDRIMLIADDEDNGLIIDSRVENHHDEPCNIIVSYRMHPTKHQYGFNCENNSTGKLINEKMSFLMCDSAAHCNTFYQHNRLGANCLKKGDDCEYCRYMEQSALYKPGFLTCKNEGQIYAQSFFFSIPQFEDDIPELYFRWEDALPEKMMWLEPISNETYVNDSITIFCQISRYYFAYGHHFAVELENGTFQYENADDGELYDTFNTNRINITVHLSDLQQRQVYCLAPVWKTGAWVNQSVTIDVLPDPTIPTFLMKNTYPETLIWHMGEMNKSISCEAEGKPTPIMGWVETVKGANESFQMENAEGFTELMFPRVVEDIDGIYVCEATNFMGSKKKLFRIRVLDPYKVILNAILFTCVGALVLSIILMILCWKKIEQQKKRIRLLTEAEIKEFLEGNVDVVQCNDYLDTSELIQSLPYNPKFEIPKEMIHIDESNVLGSGNFGQVLKGYVQLQNKNGGGGGGKSNKQALRGTNSIDVAVKTVKHNMEVVYFKTLLSEVKIMAHIGKHPNIVSLVGACTRNIRKREIFIAVEFCNNGSVDRFLRKNRARFINLVQDDVLQSPPEKHNPYENVDENEDGKGSSVNTYHMVKWCREIANGMGFLGNKKIIHGDLATRNVFLSDELVAKIGDFGLSRQLLEYSNYVKSQDCPLPWKWMAPESLQDMKFSVYSDIWAYGITIWEIFTLAHVPYPGVTWSHDFLDQLCNGMRMHKPSYANFAIYNMMLDCWHLDPSSRPSFTEIKEFFEKLLMEKTPEDYFMLTPTLNTTNAATSSSMYINMSEGINPSMSFSPSGDSGIAEDTQGYLLPLNEGATSP